MRKVYVDSNYHCHVVDDDTMTAVEDVFFDGKCDVFVEGYCYEIKENSVSIYPWKPYSELDAAQRDYERQLLADYEAALTEAGAAGAQAMHDTMLADMDAAYREGVASA